MITNPKKGQVILFTASELSHSWNNGLFVIATVNKKTHIVTMHKLHTDGTRQLTVSGTSYKNNPRLTLTKLTYKL